MRLAGPARDLQPSRQLGLAARAGARRLPYHDHRANPWRPVLVRPAEQARHPALEWPKAGPSRQLTWSPRTPTCAAVRAGFSRSAPPDTQIKVSEPSRVRVVGVVIAIVAALEPCRQAPGRVALSTADSRRMSPATAGFGRVQPGKMSPEKGERSSHRYR